MNEALKVTNRDLFSKADECTKYQIIVDFIRDCGEFAAKKRFREWLDQEAKETTDGKG